MAMSPQAGSDWFRVEVAMKRIFVLLIGLLITSLAITQDDKLRQEYEEKRLAAKQNVKGQLELAKWCEVKKLKEEAMKAYERVIEMDPENELARKGLGYKKVLGRWTCEKDYKDTSWWAHPKVDQKRVDDAIVKGCEFLLNNSGRLPEVKHPHGKFRCDELVLLTLVQAGWDRKDPRFVGLVQRVLSLPMDRNYHVMLKAMALAEIDPLKYQQYLAQTAQFIVDNQCENGQWTYGKPVPHMPPPGSYPTTHKNGPIPDISTGVQEEKPDPKAKDKGPGQIEIKKGQSVGEKTGDNSNSQYAALGLRACLMGLVCVPKETIQKAHDWWEKNQKADGGWGYGAGADGNSGMPNEPSWGSMSAGALGSLVIYKYYLKRVWNDNQDWKGAPSITKGVGWMGSNITYNENPKHPDLNAWHHYWIYAIERAGRLLETENFGSHEWYVEGANWLLPRQQGDGSWQKEDWAKGGPIPAAAANGNKEQLLPGAITETCFAILFLRRATPKITDTIKIESGDVKGGKVIKGDPEKK
jgi:hypothetical protein